MTEERFEQIIEDAADRFDKSVNQAWNHKPVRMIGKTISLLTGAGLITSAVLFAQKGRETAAKICLISGCLVIASEVIQFFVFRRK